MMLGSPAIIDESEDVEEANDKFTEDEINEDAESIDHKKEKEELQRAVLEAHMDRMGLFDFVGFEFAFLPDNNKYEKLPETLAHKSSTKQGAGGSFITIIKSFIGIAVLSVPYCIQKGGYIGAPVGLLVIAAIAHHCMQLLLVTSKSVRGRAAMSFSGLGKTLLGQWGKRVVEFSLVGSQVGFCIAYLIFIAENVADVVCIETHNTVCMSKNTVATAAGLILLPFVFLRNLSALVIPTLMANMALLGGIVWVYYSAGRTLGTRGHAAPHLLAFNWKEYPIFFGLAVFTFEGIGLVLPIQHVMEKPEMLPHLLRVAMVILVTLFLSFGIVGYIAWGEETNSMVTFNLGRNKITSFLRLFYSLGVFFSFPMMMMPVYNLTETKYSCFQGNMQRIRVMIFRAIVVAICVLLAVSIPHFGLFLGLIGSVCCTLLAFIMPALFHLKRPDRTNATKLGDIKDWAIVSFGLIAGTISFYFTLLEFFGDSE